MRDLLESQEKRLKIDQDNIVLQDVIDKILETTQDLAQIEVHGTDRAFSRVRKNLIDTEKLLRIFRSRIRYERAIDAGLRKSSKNQ